MHVHMHRCPTPRSDHAMQAVDQPTSVCSLAQTTSADVQQVGSQAALQLNALATSVQQQLSQLTAQVGALQAQVSRLQLVTQNVGQVRVALEDSEAD